MSYPNLYAWSMLGTSYEWYASEGISKNLLDKYLTCVRVSHEYKLHSLKTTTSSALLNGNLHK